MIRSNWVRAVLSLLVASSGTGLMATETIIQEIDGWKIVIQPGDFGPPKASSQVVPPSPKSQGAVRKTTVKKELQLISLQSEAAPPDKPLAPAPVPKSDDDLPIITPGIYGSSDLSNGCDPTSGQSGPVAMARLYSEVYHTIPFNRTEYNANPGYRHEAAMEILFGQLRPTVIHKGTVQVYNQSPLGYCHPTTRLVIPAVGLRIHRTN